MNADLIGEIIWYGMFAIPFITIPTMWYFSEHKNLKTVLYAVMISGLLMMFCFFIVLLIATRNGLGPT